MLDASTIEQFKTEGYAAIPGVFDDRLLAVATSGLSSLCEEDLSVPLDKLDRRHVFFVQASARRPELNVLIFSPQYEEICRQLLGPNVWAINDQFSYKPARSADQAGVFDWHQDSGYIDAPHVPYLTTVVALTDLTVENGTTRVVPRSKAITKDPVSGAYGLDNDAVRPHIGDEKGVALEVPKGGIGLFRSDIFHVAGANASDQNRGVYVIQFSAEPELGTPGQRIYLKGRPFLQQGRRASAMGADAAA